MDSKVTQNPLNISRPFKKLHPVKKLRLWVNSLILGSISALLATLPAEAAAKIFFLYYNTPVRLSLSVDSLNAFAREGKVNQQLGFYFRVAGADAQTQEEFRRALTDRANIDPLLLSRFFNTKIGEAILTRVGNLINIQGGINGKYALRGAMIQSALEPEGLTLINFLDNLPTNVQIDIAKVLDLSRVINILIDATKQFSEDVAKLSAIEAKNDTPVDFSKMRDLRELGSYGVQPKETWYLTDSSRDRQFYVNVYRPQRWKTGKTPVVIISHGLASRPEDFEGMAQHLASNGYVVALPQHPGSDFQKVQALIEGSGREVFALNEFIDRPKDISYVIDELERRNQAQFGGRLDLTSVGVGGHSFGGYGALAVAGATIDFDFLEEQCNQRFNHLNISLLLQCRALELPRKDYNFRDERVSAVIGANPVNSSIFGPKGLAQIKIPVMIGAGTFDPATPIIFEQVRSFPWFTTPDKYLFVIEGQAHVDFSQLDAGISDMIDSVDNLTLPSPDLLQSYSRAMFLAFMQVYVAQDASYRPYLQASYSAYLSQGQEFKAFLITRASSERLAQDIEAFRAKHRPSQKL